MKEINKTDLSSGQPKILEYLLENDGAKSIEIACGCTLDKSTVASLLIRMEKTGLIKREKDDKDGRSFNIFLTEFGKKRAFEVKEICKIVDESAMRGISPEKQEEFLETLNKVIENLAHENRV
ncbi:MAG: MarR family transcriptional regulator [Peptostreptococcus sp.]